MPMIVYKVMYAPRLGVFLGFGSDGPIWSIKNKKDATKDRLAPIFEDQAGFDSYLKSATTGSGQPPIELPEGAELREVWPTGPSGTASSDDCKNSGLPGWGD